MAEYYSVMTQIGLASIARASTLNEKVDFKYIAVGDKSTNPDINTKTLGNEVWQGQIGGISIHPNNPNWIILTSIIPVSVGGWTIKEVGIKNSKGDLLAVAKYPDTYKPILEEGAGKDLLVRIVIEVSNTDVIELKVDPTVLLATKEELNKKVDLGEDGKIVKEQLPELDEYLELKFYELRGNFPSTGNTKKIYVDKTNEKIYRWSGTEYKELSKSLDIGEIKGTAFDGARGKALEDGLKKVYTKTEIDRMVKNLKEEISGDIYSQIIALI